jgi:hypothetical protein
MVVVIDFFYQILLFQIYKIISYILTFLSNKIKHNKIYNFIKIF